MEYKRERAGDGHKTAQKMPCGKSFVDVCLEISEDS